MNIREKLDEIVGKVKSDKGFAEKFKKEPIKAVESVLGVDLPDDQVRALVEGVKARLNLAGGKADGKAEDILGSLKKLF